MLHRKLYTSVCVIVLMSILAACGGQAPTPPTAIPPTATTAAAVASPVSAAPTSAPPPTALSAPIVASVPTAVPKPTGQEVSVNTLWVSTQSDGTASGGTTKATIKVVPAAQQGQLRVGFFEEEVGGIGAQWHSSGWMAVTLASLLLGVDPRNYEFSFSTGGRIDGPSAGGLMTVGTLAALRGDHVNQDMAMTGTINPDGSIGPVGGIPQKVQGAAAAKFKTVLIPAGQRFDFDVNTKQSVDLVSLGHSLGVNVQEVSTVYDAYQLMTGSPLPHPTVPLSSPQLPATAFDRVKAKAQEWYGQYTKARNLYTTYPPDIQNTFSSGVAKADDLANKANDALQQGLASVAYGRAWQAATYMQLYNLAADIVQRYQTQGLDGVTKELQASSTAATQMDATVQLLKTEQPKTVADQLALIDSFAYVGMGQGLLVLAQNRIADLKANMAKMTTQDILKELVYAALYYTLADSLVGRAKDSIDISFGFGQTPMTDPNRVQAMSELLRRASDANVSFFESVIIDEYAQKWGVSSDRAKAIFQAIDSEYLLTAASNAGVQALAGSVNEQPAASSLVLGQGIGSYTYSSDLIAKYYSLNAQIDENGNVTGIGRERALADMLDLADQRAKEMISLNGSDVPVPAVIYYENARIERQGTAEDQLSALGDYWAATSFASVGAYLAGKFGNQQ